MEWGSDLKKSWSEGGLVASLGVRGEYSSAQDTGRCLASRWLLCWSCAHDWSIVRSNMLCGWSSMAAWLEQCCDYRSHPR